MKDIDDLLLAGTIRLGLPPNEYNFESLTNHPALSTTIFLRLNFHSLLTITAEELAAADSEVRFIYSVQHHMLTLLMYKMQAQADQLKKLLDAGG